MATVDDVYDRLARLEESQRHLATKADLEAVRGELRAEMVELRTDIARMGSHLAWRLTGGLIAILVALVGFMGVLTFQQL